MPQIESWSRLPTRIREHLIERMRDRDISIEDLRAGQAATGEKI